MKRLVELCGAILGLLLIAAGVVLATRPVKITIPAGAGYPETIMTFRVGRFGGDRAIARVSSVHFASPGWTARLTGGRWKRSAGGTYIAFACEAASAACMQATRGTGQYRYVLYPFTTPAPSKTGEYRLVWDVQPPGDTLDDVVIVDETSQPTAVPEPSTIVLIGSGAAMLGGIVVRRRRKQRK